MNDAQHFSDGYRVRVMTELDVGLATSIWIARASSAEEATAIVGRKEPSACKVEITGRASLETVDRLGLASGQAWRI
jgi:hypothetical protein